MRAGTIDSVVAILCGLVFGVFATASGLSTDSAYAKHDVSGTLTTHGRDRL
jgi:hypothetical protein